MNQANIDMMRRHMELEEVNKSTDILAEMTDPPEYLIPGFSEDLITSGETISFIHNELFTSLEGLTIEIVAMDASDECGFCEVVLRGRHVRDFGGLPATGEMIWLKACSVFLFENGKIKRETVYYDISEIANQLGWTEEFHPPA